MCRGLPAIAPVLQRKKISTADLFLSIARPDICLISLINVEISPFILGALFQKVMAVPSENGS